MKITFLGTGTSQGVPVIACPCEVCKSNDSRDKRLRTAALVEWDRSKLVIDAGPDFRQQMLREQVKEIDAILITHAHKDHTAGLDDVRAFNYFLKRKIDVYATVESQQALKQEFYYAFNERNPYPYIPQINLRTIDVHPFFIDHHEIIPILVYHDAMPVLGFRFKDLTYITDANRIPESEIEKIKGSRILVLNALRLEKHISHFSLNEAIELAQHIGAEKTFFIHISHQLGKYEEVSRTLPKSIFLAYDGLRVELD